MGKTSGGELGQVLGQRRRPRRLLALQSQLGLNSVPDDDVGHLVEAAHDFLLGLSLLSAQHAVAPKPEPVAQRVQLLAFIETACCKKFMTTVGYTIGHQRLLKL